VGLPAVHAQTCGLVETSAFEVPPSGATTLSTGVDFGSSLAVSGIRIAVGARETGGGTGFVTVFRTDTEPWTVEAGGLRANNSATGDEFGYDVAMDGDVLVIGAPFRWSNTLQDSGAAYILTRSGSTWSEGPMLTAPTVQSFAEFGHSVAIAGDLIAVGAPLENSGGQTRSGAVHLYKLIGSTWTHVRTLTAPTTVAENRFGFAIAMEGTTLVVGAPRRKEGSDPINSGAAFVFDLSDSNPTNWALTDTLRDPDPDDPINPDVGQQFGRSVAIHGDTIAVGAPFDSRVGPLCPSQGGASVAEQIGAVHVFREVSGNWLHEEAIRLPAPMCDAFRFGWSVALTDGHLLAGAADDRFSFQLYGFGGYLATRTPLGWLVHRRLVRESGPLVDSDLFGWATAFLETGEPLVSSPVWFNDGPFVESGRVHRFNITGADCNSNGIDDCIELANCAALDCNGNGIPDCCDIDSEFSADLNNNGIPDECEDRLDCGASDPTDCNNNLIPDECERSGQYDLIFMIDESTSVSEILWEDQLRAITTAICDPPAGEPALITANGLVRVAVISYDGDLSCNTSRIRIPLTTLVTGSGGPSGSMTASQFCEAVDGIEQTGTVQLTALSGSMQCALDMFRDANGAYRRQLVILGDGEITGTDYFDATTIADTLRKLAADMSIEGLSAGVSFLQIQFACTGPIIFSDFMSALVNQPFEPPFRPCLPSGLWECATPSAAGLHAALRRMIFQNLLRCPGSSEDVPFCGLTPWMWDRNGNGIPDCIDILTRFSLDLDEDGIPDECQDGSLGPCPADLNNDCGVDSGDLIILLSAWGPCGSGPCPADLDGSGTVDSADLLELLNAWGACYSMDTTHPCTAVQSHRYEILPPQSIADCMARYSGDTAELIGCIEAMIIAGTP